MPEPILNNNSERETRRVPLTGQPNCRDLGGYATVDGRTVKYGLVYRSGELSTLTNDDVVTLQELGVTTVIDFRSEAEVAARGVDRLPEGVELLALRIEPGDIGAILQRAFETGHLSALPDDMLADVNRAIISDAAGQISRLFDVLSTPSELPLLFHCTHGKDRAGVASAIVLMALGVPSETAKVDYLKSNGYRRTENEQQLAQLRQVIGGVQASDPADVDMSKINQLFFLEPSYFDAMLDEIKKRYGSFESYLEEGLKISHTQLKELRKRLTE